MIKLLKRVLSQGRLPTWVGDPEDELGTKPPWACVQGHIHASSVLDVSLQP